MSDVSNGRDATVLHLTVDDVLDVFADAFGCTREVAADQVRTLDGLVSAVYQPMNYANYMGADIALQAAVLAHGIAEGQVFFDGNKTTALAAMLAFLDLNDFRLIGVTNDSLIEWMLDMSAGLTPEELAERIRTVISPAS